MSTLCYCSAPTYFPSTELPEFAMPTVGASSAGFSLLCALVLDAVHSLASLWIGLSYLLSLCTSIVSGQIKMGAPCRSERQPAAWSFPMSSRMRSMQWAAQPFQNMEGLFAFKIALVASFTFALSLTA
ncbi:hypothetical protein BS78_10G027100 [Paspalum vaginatum]|nr:hypothetical protein BS78_10G027100 [Paspalum vaginatum]